MEPGLCGGVVKVREKTGDLGQGCTRDSSDKPVLKFLAEPGPGRLMALAADSVSWGDVIYRFLKFAAVDNTDEL